MNQSTTPRGYVSRVKFQVTDQIIKNACQADSRHCMIAEAIAAKLPHVRNISVDMMNIRWSDPKTGWRYIYMAPKPTQHALIRYDMGLEIKPFDFEVRSGVATPMHLGTGKERKRAHKVKENKILKTGDKGTVAHSVARDSVPMWPAKRDTAIPGMKVNPDRVPVSGKRGRPKEWHPSHNSLREFGLRGFTEGYQPT